MTIAFAGGFEMAGLASAINTIPGNLELTTFE
jgi:hypothetical protein